MILGFFKLWEEDAESYVIGDVEMKEISIEKTTIVLHVALYSMCLGKSLYYIAATYLTFLPPLVLALVIKFMILFPYQASEHRTQLRIGFEKVENYV